MLENLIEGSKNLIRRMKKPFTVTLAGLTLLTATYTLYSCNESSNISRGYSESSNIPYDYSTPQKAFQTYVEVSKKKDFNEFLRTYGFNNEEIKRILNTKREMVSVSMSSGFNSEDNIYEVVDTKYGLFKGEELGLIKVIITNQLFGTKNEVYYIFLNDGGSWVIADTVNSLRKINDPYDKSTTKGNKHKSNLLKTFREEFFHPDSF